MSELFEKKKYPEFKPEKDGIYVTNFGELEFIHGAWHNVDFPEITLPATYFLQPLPATEGERNMQWLNGKSYRLDCFHNGCKLNCEGCPDNQQPQAETVGLEGVFNNFFSDEGFDVTTNKTIIMEAMQAAIAEDRKGREPQQPEIDYERVFKSFIPKGSSIRHAVSEYIAIKMMQEVYRLSKGETERIREQLTNLMTFQIELKNKDLNKCLDKITQLQSEIDQRKQSHIVVEVPIQKWNLHNDTEYIIAYKNGFNFCIDQIKRRNPNLKFE